MKKLILTITFLLAGLAILVQTSQAQNLTAPSTPDINAPARTAVSPYVQSVPNDSYTFMAFSHPSLSTAATQIGVIVEILGMATVPDDTGGASVAFTIDAGDTHRVFVVNQNHSSIFVGASSFSDDRTHIITAQESSQFGSVRVFGINENPMVPDDDGKFDNVGQISMWGVVFIPSSGTGFAMEFIGDAHDSTITPDVAAGLNARGDIASSTGAARGIN